MIEPWQAGRRRLMLWTCRLLPSKRLAGSIRTAVVLICDCDVGVGCPKKKSRALARL